MKKSTALIMAGVVVSGLVFGGYMLSKKEGYVESVPYRMTKGVNYMSSSVDQEMLQMPSLEEEVLSFDFLTEEERQQLISDEKATIPHYEKIRELSKEVDQITEKIENKNASLLQEYDDLLLKNDELWKKLIQGKNIEDFGEDTNREIIKKSTLSEEEKKQLLENEDRFDQMDIEVNKMYDEIEKETSELNQQIENEYEKIDQILQRSDAIWEKVMKHFEADTDKVEAIPY